MYYKRFPLLFSKRQVFITLLLVLVAIWATIPAIRALTLIANPFNRSAPHNPFPDLPVTEVHFPALDGVHLAGWLVIASHQAPTIILVHGFI